jgi:hypothetical protein
MSFLVIQFVAVFFQQVFRFHFLEAGKRLFLSQPLAARLVFKAVHERAAQFIERTIFSLARGTARMAGVTIGPIFTFISATRMHAERTSHGVAEERTLGVTIGNDFNKKAAVI